jgi:hypothetical protein
MNANEAELVTVVLHSEDGRILQYIKNLIPVTEADRMKAAARLRAEEKKAAALVKDTDALVEKAAHLPSTSEQKPAARPAPVPQQRAVPRAPAVMASVADPDAVVPARDAVVPARVVAAAKRRREQDAQFAAERRKKLEAEQREAAAKARKILSEYTIKDGKQVGRALMLDLIDRTPPGHQASNVDKALDEIMRRTLKKLQDHKDYPLTKWPEFPAFFERGFWLGANEAVTEFNNKPKPSSEPAPPQQAVACQNALLALWN